LNWLRRRAVKKFIENPDKYLVVNPKFCDHKFVDGICTKCKITKEKWMKESPYNIEE